MRVFGIPGSLRRASYNTAALRAARDLHAAGLPAPVERLRVQLRAADAMLFVTLGYNYSISGVLKNAIDWAFRPTDQPFDGKSVAIMGATGSLLGSARAPHQLRQTSVWLNAFPVNKPEAPIGQAAFKFDAGGRLTDETTHGLVRRMLGALEQWTARLQHGAEPALMVKAS